MNKLGISNYLENCEITLENDEDTVMEIPANAIIAALDSIPFDEFDLDDFMTELVEAISDETGFCVLNFPTLDTDKLVEIASEK